MSRPCPEERAKRKHIDKTMGVSTVSKDSSDDTSPIPGMTLIEGGVRLIIGGGGVAGKVLQKEKENGLLTFLLGEIVLFSTPHPYFLIQNIRPPNEQEQFETEQKQILSTISKTNATRISNSEYSNKEQSINAAVSFVSLNAVLLSNIPQNFKEKPESFLKTE
ncbi:hypothetical protein CEXT_579891 [Caerostris extrusa]|uniref:Uncharacterized protein n=1 Tax=Caerostris extrusa TaxID=172846 RepID=A0AAV4TWE1_CAEEX|nr:hypothetical protein CEXT_579891 [Caerostris extrusa]